MIKYPGLKSLGGNYWSFSIFAFVTRLFLTNVDPYRYKKQWVKNFSARVWSLKFELLRLRSSNSMAAVTTQKNHVCFILTSSKINPFIRCFVLCIDVIICWDFATSMTFRWLFSEVYKRPDRRPWFFFLTDQAGPSVICSIEQFKIVMLFLYFSRTGSVFSY